MHNESRLVTADEVAAVSAAAAASLQIDAERGRAPARNHHVGRIRGTGRNVLRRGSSRAFAQEAITAENSRPSWPLPATIRRPTFLALTNTYLIVNAAEGMEPGAYYYDRQARAFELLKAGNFRGEAGYLCLEQPLGMDCSALVVYMADLERALSAFGNRGYGDAHLEAGILGGRAYLAAYSFRTRRDRTHFLRRRHDEIFRTSRGG